MNLASSTEPKDIRITIEIGDATLGGYLIEGISPSQVKSELVEALHDWAATIEAMA